ncbi:MAG TPA: hypothetical protein VHK47_14540 [Polyangia bacterium]|nr:hypothetical protein [Polyangia bacterium]
MYITTALDSLTLVGTGLPAGPTVSIVVGMGGGAALGGAYTRGVSTDGGTSTSSAALTYDNRPAPTGETCSIALTFTSGGDGHPHASGSFEAALPGDGGATTLTEGKFDVPVNQTGG